MGNAELQELVKAYAEGKVEFSKYREQRSELLDAITENRSLKDGKADDQNKAQDIKAQEATENEIDDNEEAISLINNRSPVVFLLIVTIVLVSFVYVLTLI